MALPQPKMSIAEAYKILTGPGSKFETVPAVVRGETYNVYKHQPPSLRSIAQSLKARGDAPYIVYAEERLTYAETFRRVATLAHVLIRCGVQKGDRVGILMRNLPEWIISWWVGHSVGAIVVPINAWLVGDELDFALIDSEVSVLFVDVERLDRIAPFIPKLAKNALRQILVTRSDKASLKKHSQAAVPIESFDDVLANAPVASDLPDVTVLPDDDCTIMYSSGTTGKPKGILNTNRGNMSAMITRPLLALRNALRRGEQLPSNSSPPPPPPVVLIPVPLFHVTGNNALLIPTTFQGGKVILMYKWNADEAMQLIEKERVTASTFVPSMIWQLLDSEKRYDLSSLTGIGSGGAPAAPELVVQMKKKWPSSTPSNGWGMTETGSIGCNNTGEDFLRKPDSIGPPIPIVQVKIVDAHTLNEVPLGETGEICVRAAGVMRGYWKRPEATKESFIEPGHWLRTGDIGRMDEDSFVYIADRAKDMLIRGGENIYSKEIEDVLFSHPAVMDAAVVGLPDKVLGEEVACAVQLKHDYFGHVTQQDLQAHVRSKLAAFKVPVFIDIRNEPLLRNAAGKVIKSELKKQLIPLAQQSRINAKL